MTFLYKWLPIFFGCHCKPERSFYFCKLEKTNNCLHLKKYRRFPICARCTGELIGMLIAPIIFILWKNPQINILLIMMIPLIVDGFVQQLTKYESNNFKRLITGILFGISLMMFILVFTRLSFVKGIHIGRNLTI